MGFKLSFRRLLWFWSVTQNHEKSFVFSPNEGTAALHGIGEVGLGWLLRTYDSFIL